ncbi:hypothetical protein FQN54_004941 [Arachnomyces sp. PD_36]|nr:hypothetical protein FQN54_004941 [Arachnomyces sp. PD_36]
MASRYNLIEYDSDEEKEKYPDIPLPNLVSAALFIAGLFDRSGIPYAVMGGFAVKLMGGTRDTRDVDIAFQAPGKMGDLWRIVEAESRLVIPNTKLLSNIVKVFVLTGPGHDNCEQSIPVEVDLIENGYQNSPRELGSNRRPLTINSTSGQKQIYAIDIFYLLQGKMAAFSTRASNNDMRDIQYLLRTFSNEIRGFSNRLNPEAVTAFLEAVPAQHRPQWRSFMGL